MLSGLLLVSFGAAAQAQDAGDPLEELKSRSAKQRWEELSSQWEKVRPVEAGRPQVATQADRPFASVPAPIDVNDADIETSDSVPTQVAASVRPVRYASQQDRETPSQPYTEIVRDPSQLKKLTDILPYDDYEPNADIRANDPCENLCPRPDGTDCKVYAEGERRPECPEEIRLSEGTYEGRLLPETVFTWEASNLYHHPLYFEDPQLERYGHTHGHCVQPFVSGGRFVTQLMGLPYQMTLHPLCSKRYTLGWYRPGECAPKQIYQIPLNLHAAAVTAAFYTGMIYAIP